MIPKYHLLNQTSKDLFLHFFMREHTNQGPIRFNDLLRELDEDGFKISRPTLDKHLKILTKNKFITRKEINKQNVQYEYNKEFVELIDYHDERTQKEKQIMETINEFNSLPPYQQVENTLRVITVQEIQNLILMVKSIREPDKQHQYYLQMRIGDSIKTWYSKWLLNNCSKNGQEYQNEILELLEEIHESLSKEG